MTDDFVVVDAAGRQRWVDEIERQGQEHVLPLVRMLKHGAALCLVPPGTQFPSWRKLQRRGAVVMVLADTPAEAFGPEAFHVRSLRKLAMRASAWAVVAGRPPDAFYEAAAAMAIGGAMVILVDTTSAHERGWVDWLNANGRKTAGKALISPNAAGWQAMQDGRGATRH